MRSHNLIVSSIALSLVLISTTGLTVSPNGQSGELAFTDDFEGDLARWEIVGGQAIGIVDSGNPSHGRVLELRPDGWNVFALAKGSDRPHGVAIEGDVMFPRDGHSYLGVLYNFSRSDERTDFGNIYIKGNGSYIRVNPHRDGNVGRTLYEEYRTELVGEAAVRVGQWQRFRLETVGSEAHFYVGDMSQPQLTFALLELESGLVGLQPRCCGAPVWVDNVTVSSIERLEYAGPPLPNTRVYEPEELLTAWQVIGPLRSADKALERSPDGTGHPWRPFAVDMRGAVISSRVTHYEGDQTVAYFRTTVRSEGEGESILHLSTVDDLQIWLNGRFYGHLARHGLAWYDFWKNPDHAGTRWPIPLEPGDNQILIRVRGGVYASGGFYARLEPR